MSSTSKRAENLKHLKNIKEILNFLNKNFPGKDYPKFRGMLPSDSEPGWKNWYIVTDDWWLYNGRNEQREEFDICKEAIRKKFKFPILFCYQYYITTEIHKKNGYLVVS